MYSKNRIQNRLQNKNGQVVFILSNRFNPVRDCENKMYDIFNNKKD